MMTMTTTNYGEFLYSHPPLKTRPDDLEVHNLGRNLDDDKVKHFLSEELAKSISQRDNHQVPF